MYEAFPHKIGQGTNKLKPLSPFVLHIYEGRAWA